jgi:hypothetical protein
MGWQTKAQSHQLIGGAYRIRPAYSSHTTTIHSPCEHLARGAISFDISACSATPWRALGYQHHGVSPPMVTLLVILSFGCEGSTSKLLRVEGPSAEPQDDKRSRKFTKADFHAMEARKDEFIGKNQKNIPQVGKIEERTIVNHQHINKVTFSTNSSSRRLCAGRYTIKIKNNI